MLRKKPGALAGSTPLAQWRQAGRWPECFDRLWQALITRHGRQQGTRLMIELLSLGAAEGWDRLRTAVEEALSLGCHDVAAIRHLLVAGRLRRPAIAAIEVGALARYERPQPVLSGYDQLLREGAGMKVASKTWRGRRSNNSAAPCACRPSPSNALPWRMLQSSSGRPICAIWKRCWPPSWKSASATPSPGASRTPGCRG